MEHQLEIAAWRSQLPPKKRLAYNHPSTVWRAWNKEHGVSAAVKKGPSKMEMIQAANLRPQDERDASGLGGSRHPSISVPVLTVLRSVIWSALTALVSLLPLQDRIILYPFAGNYFYNPLNHSLSR
jgi:hypothetical protein